MKSIKFLWSGVIILVILLFASYLIPNFYLSRPAAASGVNNTNAYRNYNDNLNGANRGRWDSQGYGMMGGYRGMMGGNYGNGPRQYTNEGLSEEQVNNDIANSMQNATVDKKNNSISYSGDNIKIVMLASTKKADDKFEIGGLVNPIVYVPKNTTVTLELVNEDEDVAHAFEITDATPPYAYMTMMQGQVYPGGFIGIIPPSEGNKFYKGSTSFTSNYTGEFYYICQYPGHAEKGMYGKIIVK